MYDAIIVGARAAGAATALLLARAGLRVLLVDRARSPGDDASSHLVQVAGVARLRRWGGVDEALASSGAPPARGLALDVGPFVLRAAVRAADGTDYGYAPQRGVLDRVLVHAATRAGAEFRGDYEVAGLLFDAGRVTGVRGRQGVEHARVVVGADGRDSLVARAVGAHGYQPRPARTRHVESSWEDLPVEGVELYWRERGALLAAPTHDGLTMLALAAPAAERERESTGPEASLERALADAPALRERLRGARRVGRFRVTGDTAALLRAPAGPGWALVGDAGHHKNPITAQGIMDALRDAELVADALQRGLSGETPLDAALAAYHVERDAGLMASYELTDELARLDLPAEMPLLFAALREDPEQTAAFLGTLAGTTPTEAFYDPGNLRRIMRRVGSLRAGG